MPALQDERIRRDLIKYCRTRFVDADLVRATERLADIRRRRAGAVEPQPGHARRPCDPARPSWSNGSLRYVDDANVLIMLDQPEQTAREIGGFLRR